jgi:hypothetical protein
MLNRALPGKTGQPLAARDNLDPSSPVLTLKLPPKRCGESATVRRQRTGVLTDRSCLQAARTFRPSSERLTRSAPASSTSQPNP